MNSDEYHQLNQRLDKCNELWDEFNKVQIEIEYIDDSDEQIQESATFDNMLFELIGKAKGFLVTVNQQIQNTLDTNNSVNSQINTNIVSNVKLPPLALPTFNGVYENWLQFH